MQLSLLRYSSTRYDSAYVQTITLTTGQHTYYFRQKGYVIASVCLFVCQEDYTQS